MFSPILIACLLKAITSDSFSVIILLIFADFTTGFLKSLLLKNVNSSIGISGFVKHSGVVILSLGFLTLEGYSSGIHSSIGLQGIITFVILIYVLSIIENLNDMGVPLPSWLISRLKNELEDIEDDKKG